MRCHQRHVLPAGGEPLHQYEGQWHSRVHDRLHPREPERSGSDDELCDRCLARLLGLDRRRAPTSLARNRNKNRQSQVDALTSTKHGHLRARAEAGTRHHRPREHAHEGSSCVADAIHQARAECQPSLLTIRCPGFLTSQGVRQLPSTKLGLTFSIACPAIAKQSARLPAQRRGPCATSDCGETAEDTYHSLDVLIDATRSALPGLSQLCE